MRLHSVISALILVLPGFAQTTVPKSKDGHPDLTGFWNNANLTPFQRPAGLGDKQYFTADEAKAFEKERLQEVDRDRRDGGKSQADLDGAYNEAWFDRGTRIAKTGRTSLIIDPPDGRIPPLTQAAKTKFDRINAELAEHAADNPEDLPLPVRCLMFSQVGPPMLPGNYNDNYEIVQSPGYVSILAEMGNITRVIPLAESRTCRPTCGNGQATPRAIGKARRWSSIPPVSVTPAGAASEWFSADRAMRICT